MFKTKEEVQRERNACRGLRGVGSCVGGLCFRERCYQWIGAVEVDWMREQLDRTAR